MTKSADSPDFHPFSLSRILPGVFIEGNAIIGDDVHTGINTSIYPGRKLCPGTTTRPGEIVSHDVVPG